MKESQQCFKYDIWILYHLKNIQHLNHKCPYLKGWTYERKKHLRKIKNFIQLQKLYDNAIYLLDREIL